MLFFKSLSVRPRYKIFKSLQQIFVYIFFFRTKTVVIKQNEQHVYKAQCSIQTISPIRKSLPQDSHASDLCDGVGRRDDAACTSTTAGESGAVMRGMFMIMLTRSYWADDWLRMRREMNPEEERRKWVWIDGQRKRLHFDIS